MLSDSQTDEMDTMIVSEVMEEVIDAVEINVAKHQVLQQELIGE